MAIDSLAPGGPVGSPPPGQGPDYEVGVTYEAGTERNRLWAFPVLGGVAKLIVLIPHFVILFFLGIAFSPTFTYNNGGGFRNTQFTFAGLAFMILWIPVLFGGRMPLWGYAFVGGFLRWSVRVAAFVLGLTDRYPPFSMRTAAHPVEVGIHIPDSNNRWWAFPVLGFYAKQIILIPHFICLIGLFFVVFVLWLVMWVPVVISGHFPAPVYQLFGGVIRWAIRVSAFQGGLTDRYPPFSLS